MCKLELRSNDCWSVCQALRVSVGTASWVGGQRFQVHWGGALQCEWGGLVIRIRGRFVWGMGGFDTANVTVTVNPPPIVNAGDDQVGTEGQVFAFTGVYTDNKSLTSNSYIPEVEDILWDFGDGTAVTGTLTPTHTYPDEGVFPVTLVVTDVYGAAGFDNVVVNVDNPAPLLADIPDQQVKLGEMIPVTGSFTDPGLLDMHTLTVTWALGITETMDLDPGERGFVVNHNYDVTGDYQVKIIVDDHDGGLGQTTFHIIVAAKEYLVYLLITRK